MKKVLPVLFYLFVFSFIHAQEAREQLTPLKYNQLQYRASHTHKASTHGLGLLSDKGMYIVTTDTLSLPFIDDFSTNRLRPYDWLESHVYQTYYNVYGTCLDYMNIPTQAVPYIYDFAYSYFTYPIDTTWVFTALDSTSNVDTSVVVDTVIYLVDSTIQPQTPYIYFGPNQGNGNDCFSSIPDTFYFSSPYYRYDFDLFNGQVIDSFMVSDTSIYSPWYVDTLYLAPVIYFSQGDTASLWFDNYAWVNNTFPINPPTIGVATLDGLDDFGMPYNNSSITAYGQADYLTSKPIDLSVVSPDDSSVFISFYYEAQGLGIYPKLEDSLILEIRDNQGNWNMLWADTGYSLQSEVPNQFAEVILQIPPMSPDSNSNFYNAFQFRFRNLATLTGAVDQWNIDYVKLDRNRSYADTSINDIAFVYPFPTILKNYTELPANLFNGATDLVDSIVLQVHNLSPSAVVNPPATNYVFTANETYPNQSIVYTSSVQTFNASPTDSLQLTPVTSYSILPNNPSWPVDSLAIFAAAIMSPHDVNPLNDTVTHFQNFSYSMAYDDGSAEQAYGLTGGPDIVKKFAYQFNIPKPDTLAGFQIMYDQVNDNVSQLVFSLEAWDTLQLNNYLFIDSPIIEIDNLLPLYIDSVNGFATYVLDTPMIITGTFYLGWAQTDTRNLQIGYDLNSTLGYQHMFVYLDGEWTPTTITPPGSPMIRLILDGHYQGTSSSTAVIDLRRNNGNLRVFPNPATDRVSLQIANPATVFDVDIHNMLGELVQHSTTVSSFIYVTELASGMYLLDARDEQTGILYHAKLIKTSY